MLELIPASFRCAYCGEENETVVDPSAGASQSYTEDCQACCRPHVVRVPIIGEGYMSISAEPEVLPRPEPPQPSSGSPPRVTLHTEGDDPHSTPFLSSFN